MATRWLAFQIKTDNDGSVSIYNSYDHYLKSKDPKELIEFLYSTQLKDNKTRELRFFWDIDDAMSQVFRLLSEKDCRGILEAQNGSTYKLFDYDVSYSRGRNFIIRGNKTINERQYWACYYNLKQYFRDYEEPETVNALFKLSLKLKTAFANIGIENPTTLSSPISAWESSMRKTQSTMIPNINYIPADKIKALEFAEKCAEHQGWVTNFQVGHFKADKVYAYDQSSSYGFWLSQTRNFKNVEITQYTPDYPYKQSIIDGDVTGYFECEVEIFPHVKIHPFAYKTPQGNIIYPIGKFKTHLVLEEMLSIVRNKVGTIKVIDGYYFRFLSKAKPMQNIINQLFNDRFLGDIENNLCKSIIVQMVGKSLMVNKVTGRTSKSYSPPHVAWVYAMCRLQDFEFIIKNHLEDSTVAIATDEVISTKPATITKIERAKKIMGTWRQKPVSPKLILSPGWVISDDKNPHGIDYHTIIKALKDNPNTSYYKFPSKQRVTLHKAINDLKDVSKVGTMVDTFNTIDLVEIMASQDRIFKKFPMCGKDLLSNKIYESKPMEV